MKYLNLIKKINFSSSYLPSFVRFGIVFSTSITHKRIDFFIAYIVVCLSSLTSCNSKRKEIFCRNRIPFLYFGNLMTLRYQFV